MNILILIGSLFLGVYCLFVLMLIIGWNKIPTNKTIEGENNLFISVIVVVKNEINNIEKLLQSIEKQTYSKELFEVIVVNDASDDGTLELLYQLEKTLKINLLIVDLKSDNSNLSGKKFGISKAIDVAKGTFILATDGDCTVGPKWVESYVNCYKTKGYKFISGPVTFHSNTFFAQSFLSFPITSVLLILRTFTSSSIS